MTEVVYCEQPGKYLTVGWILVIVLEDPLAFVFVCITRAIRRIWVKCTLVKYKNMGIKSHLYKIHRDMYVEYKLNADWLNIDMLTAKVTYIKYVGTCTINITFDIYSRIILKRNIIEQ